MRNGVAGKGLNRQSTPFRLLRSDHVRERETEGERRVTIGGDNSHLCVIALAKLHHTFLIEATRE